MKFDFESMVDRRGMDSLAFDAPYVRSAPGYFVDAQLRDGFSPIPMWVADMNFKTAPSVTQAIEERISHPIFGYYFPNAEYFDSIIRWHQQRNGVSGLEAKHIGYENGVLGGLSSALEVLCSKGDSVLLHSPTYVGFTHCMENNGYNIVLSPLVPDENGIWRMDFEDMEQKLVQNKIHAAVLCSPHNPTGRVWEAWELEKAMELFKKHDVFVISDEIWSDLVFEGQRHIPTQAVSDDARNRTVALYAPSKTFNLAGLIGAYRIVYNNYLRDRMDKQESLCHYNSMNVLSMHALIGAYNPEGEAWLKELLSVLQDNAEYACDFVDNNFDGVVAYRPQGSYMLYLDCEKWCKQHNIDLESLMRCGLEYGVVWQDGRPFHGEHHIRMNLALPKSVMAEAFDRLKKYVFCG